MNNQDVKNKQQSPDKTPAKMQVISAVPFQDEQKERLRRVLEKRFPGRDFDFEFTVDEEILGGVCLKSESFVLDAGYKKQLAALYASVFSRKDS